MANSLTHTLPYPVRKARFAVQLAFANSSGVPTDPTTPDTEISVDGGATSTDCVEEVATGGGQGVGYLTLTGAEMDNPAIALFAKSANCNTTRGLITPRNFPIISSGTLSAGSAGGGTLGTILPYDLKGGIIRTTGGTGGGGTGGANNQARVVATYNTTTGAYTLGTNWETTPDNTTTYDVLLTPELTVLAQINGMAPPANWNLTSVDSSGASKADITKILGTPTISPGNSGAIVVDRVLGDVEGGVSGAVGAVDSPVALIADYDAAKTAAQAGDAMTLTTGERSTIWAGIWNSLTSGMTTANSIGKRIVDFVGSFVYSTPPTPSAIATEVEAQIMDEGDGEQVLQAIVNKINSVDTNLAGLSISAIAQASRSEMDANSTRLAAIATQTAKIGANSGDSPNAVTAQTNAATAATQAATSAASAATAATQSTSAATSSAAIKIVTDKTATMLEDDPDNAGKSRLTSAAAANLESGGGGLTKQDVADAGKLAPAAGSADTGSAQAQLAAILAGVGGAGSGSVTVNHNYGGTDALRAAHGGVGIEGVTIRAYWTSEYASGLRNIIREAFTGEDGRWLQDMQLDPGAYTLSFDNPESVQAVVPIEVA